MAPHPQRVQVETGSHQEAVLVSEHRPYPGGKCPILKAEFRGLGFPQSSFPGIGVVSNASATAEDLAGKTDHLGMGRICLRLV